jgi:hypothetical protein
VAGAPLAQLAQAGLILAVALGEGAADLGDVRCELGRDALFERVELA